MNFSITGSGKGKNKVKGNASTRSSHVRRVPIIMAFNLGLHKLPLPRTGKAASSSIYINDTT